MSVGRLILLGLLGLVVAEAAVFLIVAQVFGSFAAIVALISTSVLGIAVLARMGRRLAGRLADILSQRDFGAAETRSSGFLTTVGGLLLLLPGFVTDCIGLLLLIPAVQQHLKGQGPAGRRRPAGRILDLERSQWRNLTDRHCPDERDKPAKRPPERAGRG
jgi:UPF0716 protein FxsA